MNKLQQKILWLPRTRLQNDARTRFMASYPRHSLQNQMMSGYFPAPVVAHRNFYALLYRLLVKKEDLRGGTESGVNAPKEAVIDQVGTEYYA